MIDSLHGTLIAKEMNMAVVECGGVGYACRISYQTYSKLVRWRRGIFVYDSLRSMRKGIWNYMAFSVHRNAAVSPC
ncbi:MAG: OB-fold domain-containing protein [Ruminococcus sp.]